LKIDPTAISSQGWYVEYRYSMHFYGKHIRKIIKAFGLSILEYTSPKKTAQGHTLQPINITIKF